MQTLSKVADAINEICDGGIGIKVKEAFVQGSSSEQRLDLKYEGRSAKIQFTKNPTKCTLPIQSTRLDLCYPLAGADPILTTTNQCTFPWCKESYSNSEICVTPDATTKACERPCESSNTVCEAMDEVAETTCSRVLQKFSTTPKYGITDRDEGTLASGEYGFCKTKRKESTNPKQYKGLSGEGKTESELGMLADIAIQQGFDYVKREGDYVKVAVTPDVCQVQLDAVFVLDGSHSISAPDWESTKDVVKSFIDKFDIEKVLGKEPTRVGAVGYSSDVFEDSLFHLQKYGTDSEAIKCAIGAINRKPEVTATGKTMKFVFDEMFTEANGMRTDALRIPRVVILITDGLATDSNPKETVQVYSEKLQKETGAEVYVIFIGTPKGGPNEESAKKVFRNLVSEPKDKHFFALQGITFVPSVVGEIAQSLCTKPIDLTPCCSEASMEYIRVEAGYYQYFSTPCADTSSELTVTVEAKESSMKFEVYVLIETDPTSTDLPGPITHDAKAVDSNQRVKTLTFPAPKSKNFRIAVRGMGPGATEVKLGFTLDFSDALKYNEISDRELGVFYEIGGEQAPGGLVAQVNFEDKEFTQFDESITLQNDNHILDTMRFEDAATKKYLSAIYSSNADAMKVYATDTMKANKDTSKPIAGTLAGKGVEGNECVVLSKAVEVAFLAPGATRPPVRKTTRATTAANSGGTTQPGDTTATGSTPAVDVTKIAGDDLDEDNEEGYEYEEGFISTTTTITTTSFDPQAAEVFASGTQECVEQMVAPGDQAVALEGNKVLIANGNWAAWDCDAVLVAVLVSGEATDVVHWNCDCSEFDPLWLLLLLLLCCCIPLLFFCCKRKRPEEEKEEDMIVNPAMDNPMFDGPTSSETYGDQQYAGGDDRNRSGSYLEPSQRGHAGSRAPAAVPAAVIPPAAAMPKRPVLGASKRPKAAPVKAVVPTARANTSVDDGAYLEPSQSPSNANKGKSSAIKGRISAPKPARAAMAASQKPREKPPPMRSKANSFANFIIPDETGTEKIYDNSGSMMKGAVLPPPLMKVTVITPTGERITVETDPDETLYDVAAGVTEQTGVSPDNTRFSFDGNPLPVGTLDTLDDLGIKSGAVLHILPNTLSVTVVTPEGERFNLDTLPTHRLSDLQSGVADACGIPPYAQMFQFEGNPLSNTGTDTFSDLGVTNGAVLHLMPMQIFIKDLTNTSPSSTTYTIDVKPTDTIAQVKEKATQQSGIPADRIELEFQGVNLSDETATLTDYEIRHQDTLHMVASEPPPVAAPLKFSKSHMIGVRLIDRVIHHPLIPTDDGKGITLITDDGTEPTFEWLPDLITHYSCDRFKSPFTLHNEVVGYPSLSSTSRLNWLENRAEVMDQDATPAVIDATGTSDLFFDVMFNDLLDEVFDHAIVAEDCGIYGDLSLNRPAWVVAADSPQWNDDSFVVSQYLGNRSASVADLGLDAAIERVIQAVSQSIPEHVFEEVVDRIPINGRGRVDPGAVVDFNDTQVWDTSYEDVHPWYIPDMTRSEVTDYLREVGLGEFIVYERLDSQSAPSWEQAPPIAQFERMAKARDPGDLSEDSDDEPGAIAKKKGAPGDPKVVPAKKKKKNMPKAFRFNTQVRVMRRGQELVAFKDDELLELEIDQHTRMVKGKKDGASPGKSYGRKMFKGLESLGDETQDVHGGLMNEIESHLNEMFDDADEDGDGMLSLEEAKAKGMAEETFREIDADGNGQLTQDEFRVWFTERRQCEVDGFIASYTHGILSRDEANIILEEAAAAHPADAEGLYLVRASEKKKGGCTLSMMNGGEPKHLLFKHQGEGYVCNKILFPAENLQSLIRMLVAGHPEMPKLGSFVTRKREVGNVIDATDGSNIRRKASVYLGFKENPEEEDL
jgi:hypothetical protein